MNNIWNAPNIFRAQALVLSNWPRGRVDAIFFHTRARDDDDDLFEIAADFYHYGQVKSIIFTGSDGQGMDNIPKGGWPGQDAYLKRFKKLGVPRRVILLSRIARNTREENHEFLKIAKERRFKKIAILTQAHQLLRATAGLIAEIRQEHYPLQIYCIAPKNTDWQKIVRGSQGKNPKKRLDHAEDEYHRVVKYTRKGDIAKPREFFAYFQT